MLLLYTICKKNANFSMKINKKIQVERRSLSQQLYESIKSLILSGEIKAGQRISEEALAKKFKVSRTPIRESIRRLEEYGIVRIIPRSYAEVVGITEEQATEVVQVRRQLETLSVSLLATKASQEDIKVLKRLSAQCKKFFNDNNKSKVFETDSKLHLEIALRSGNSVLFQTLERLDAKIQLIRLMHCTSSDKIEANLLFHDEIIKAIESNNIKKSVNLINKHII